MRTAVLLLLILWLSRISALETLPLHNDEGLHLTRAAEVWNLHPFWEIRDGKIINHWAIALFYPPSAPVFTGRIATVFVSLIGFAAGYALARRLFGATPALLAGALWITSPYLFFFERLALSDAEAGALVVLTLWVGWRLAARGTMRRAVVTGLALALAALFKFTAVPFAASVALIVLLRARYAVGRRFLVLIFAALVVAVCFAVPVGYLVLRGDDLFSIALGWIGGGSGGNAGTQMGVGANLAMLGAQLTGFGIPLWSAALAAGLVLLLSLRPRAGGILLLAVGVPLASIIVLGREVLPRHIVVVMPALLVLGGAGIGLAVEQLALISRNDLASRPYSATILTVLILAALALGFAPFALTAYASPKRLSVPDAIWTQYFSQHSAGYGLREAVEQLPEFITDETTPVVASMTGDSCRRANFYAIDMTMTCADAPGLVAMQAALSDHAVVYAVVEDATGADFPRDAEALNADTELIASYPRPTRQGETEQPVTLWKLTRR